MAKASRIVLQGYEVNTDVEITRWPDRCIDGRRSTINCCAVRSEGYSTYSGYSAYSYSGLVRARACARRVRIGVQKILDTGGASHQEVAFWANAQGYRTTTGKIFYPLTVRNLLYKKRYAGIREHNGAEYQAVWEPVFDAET